MMNYFKKIDWVLIIPPILLTGLGLAAIYSSSAGKGDFLNFKKQVIFFVIAIGVMVFTSLFDWRGLRDNPYLILALYAICVLLLIGLFFFAPITKGVRAWYKLGTFSFDPVELTKIVLIVLLAKYFSMRHVEMYRLRHILLSGFYVLWPTLLVFRQPNLGSALILVVLWAGVLIISGIKLRHFLILTLCGLLVLALGWSVLLKDYQKARVIGFLFPQADPLGINWNQAQSKIAIGSGGILGQGIGNGSQARYGFLPESQTDFIFAAIAEENGLVGVSVMLILFIILLWRVMTIAFSAQTNFPRLFASGFAIVLMAQIFIHIGMNLGVLPVIGISLPLVSYGGSGLITTYIGLGILQSIKNR